MNPAAFFVSSFTKAISENTEEAFRSIISEPSPGVLTFEMLQPRFCEMLLDEVSSITVKILICSVSYFLV